MTRRERAWKLRAVTCVPACPPLEAFATSLWAMLVPDPAVVQTDLSCKGTCRLRLDITCAVDEVQALKFFTHIARSRFKDALFAVQLEIVQEEGKVHTGKGRV